MLLPQRGCQWGPLRCHWWEEHVFSCRIWRQDKAVRTPRLPISHVSYYEPKKKVKTQIKKRGNIRQQRIKKAGFQHRATWLVVLMKFNYGKQIENLRLTFITYWSQKYMVNKQEGTHRKTTSWHTENSFTTQRKFALISMLNCST